MAISYKKLWKMLIDKDMKKKDLCIAAGISHASMAKLGKKGMNVMQFVIITGMSGSGNPGLCD